MVKSELPTAGILSPHARLIVAFATLLWAVGIAYGFEQLRHFESTPGAAGDPPPSWPAQSSIKPRFGQTTLVMLVHPECSCSSASISELSAVMRQSGGRIDAWVLFTQTDDSIKTLLWKEAAAIAGATVQIDPEGVESARFGARTSGSVAVYDSLGKLRFAGGITGARGHAGDNMGREQMLKSTAPRYSGLVTHSIFGCPLP